MLFEIRERFCDDEWCFIEPEQLTQDVPNDLIDMMIWHKATVRVGGYEYRRYIPPVIVEHWKEKQLLERSDIK